MNSKVVTTTVKEDWSWEGVLLGGEIVSDSPVFLPQHLRPRGTFIVGAPGGGKTFLMQGMSMQDIAQIHGEVCSVISVDPHGSMVRPVWDRIIAAGLHEDPSRPIAYFNPRNRRHVFGLNPLRRRFDPETGEAIRPEVIADIFRNFILTSLHNEKAEDKPQTSETLFNLGYVLYEFQWPLSKAVKLLKRQQDKSGSRAYAARHASSEAVRDFWSDIEKTKRAELRDAKLGSATRRVSAVLSSQVCQPMFSQTERVLDMRQFIDHAGVLLCDLGIDNLGLSLSEQMVIGRMLLLELYFSAFGRGKEAMPVYVYIDECHKFVVKELADMFTQTRKYNICPVVATQFPSQLKREGDDQVFEALMQAKNKIVFPGLRETEARLMCQELYTGFLDLEQPKKRYHRMEIVGYHLGWALNENSSLGLSLNAGRNWSNASSQEEGETKTVGTIDTDNWSQARRGSRSESKLESDDPDIEPAALRRVSEGEDETLALGGSHAYSESLARGKRASISKQDGGSLQLGLTATKGTGRGQILMPDLEAVPRDFYTLEEILFSTTALLMNAADGTFFCRLGLYRPRHAASLFLDEVYITDAHRQVATEESYKRLPYVTISAGGGGECASAGAKAAPIAGDAEDAQEVKDNEILTGREWLG